ncbi:drug/metabolite transporter (DMT)-like permease [Prauserella muralis]|nr:drug/metabolite transporter (DMT)-like permease [Prauserella muralis]
MTTQNALTTQLPHSRTALLQWTSAMALSGTIGAVVLESGAQAPAVAFARSLVGGLLLVLWSAARGWLRPGAIGLSRRDVALAALGGLMLVGNWVLLFASYALSSISVSTVVYHTQPLLLVGLAALLLRERLTRGHLGRALVAFGGVTLISLGAHGTAEQPVHIGGIALALGAAVLYAGASLIAKQLSHVRPHLLAAIQLGIGAVVLAPALTITPLPSSTGGLLWLVLLGAVHTAVMYVLMYGSIGRLPTATVALLSYVYPVVAVVTDVLAYGHRVTVAEAVGMAAILVAAMTPGRSRTGRGSVVARPGVVLEDQAADGDEQRGDGQDQQPHLEERERDTGDGGAGGERHRPVAAGAEEAQLTGAVADLGLLVVLGPRLDAAGDEAEVAADEQRQRTGEDQRHRADRLDTVVGHVAGHHRVDDRDDERKGRDDVEQPGFDLHGPVLTSVCDLRRLA